MKLKVCGNLLNIKEVYACAPDYMGFIFYKGSTRCIPEGQRKGDIVKLKNTQRVGVFVNEETEVIMKKISTYKLNLVQLHGDESIEMCANLQISIPVIKALNGASENLQEEINAYQFCCEYILIDYKTPNQYGGTGQSFDWNKLKSLSIKVPFFVSGGISLENYPMLDELKQLNNFYGIDVNSKFELSPGLKNINDLKRLKQLL